MVIAAGEEYLLNVKYVCIDEYGRSVLSADCAAETDDVLGGGTEIEVGVEVVAYDVLMKAAAAFVADKGTKVMKLVLCSTKLKLIL